MEAGTSFGRLCCILAEVLVAWAAVAAMQMSYVGGMLAETMNLADVLDIGRKNIYI